MNRRTFVALSIALAGCGRGKSSSSATPSATPVAKFTGQSRLDALHFIEDVEPILGRAEQFVRSDLLHKADTSDLENYSNLLR